MDCAVRVGIAGTGFIARRLVAFLSSQPDFVVSVILTRRPVSKCAQFLRAELLTNEVDALIDRSDIVLECSGDAVHAANVLLPAGEAGRQLVTMNAEAQVTIGSALIQRGFALTEGHGDQPGCFAQLDREIREFGFTPVAYVNLKGFLNKNPTREDMVYWSERQGISLRQVTSFTDGTKMQIEQALVANGLGARIARQGLIGGTVEDLADLDHLAEAGLSLGQPISDYVINPGGPPGVVILATNPAADREEGYTAFTRLKTRRNTAYRFLRPFHMVYLEVARTLRRVVSGHGPLLNNGLRPVATIAGVTKRSLPAGYVVEHAVGSFDIRGEAVEFADHPHVVPMTLMDGARLKHAVEAGHLLQEQDVDVVESRAYVLHRSTQREALCRPLVMVE